MNEGRYEQYKKDREIRRKKMAARQHLAKIIGVVFLVCVIAFGAYKFIGPKQNGVADLAPASQAPATQIQTGKEAGTLDGNIRQTPEPHEYSLRVNKGEFKIYLLDHGTPIAVWPVCVGKNPGQKEKTGDMKTPVGTFVINEITNSSTWTRDFHDGKGIVKNAYGPWYIGLDTKDLSKGKWDGIGIHGLHDSKLAGTRASEGGISMVNEDLQKLKPLLKVGTKVTIQE